ncbi:MAG: electron transport complex subunit RsxG [Magnetococcales bacterium]|nr:electron transport complex subunit RsxG [Magnetococcales bacterium]
MPEYLRMGLVLTIMSVLATAILAQTDAITQGPIAAAKREETLRALEQLLPKGFTNNPVEDTISLADKRLNRKEKPVLFYRARNGEKNLATVFMVSAPDGYSGNIDVLVCLSHDGVVQGVQIVSHAETPGLGDKVVKVPSWLEFFKGKNLMNANWAVKKDGGDFDQFAGATITPRAIVNAVKRGLEYYNANRETIFAARSGS